MTYSELVEKLNATISSKTTGLPFYDDLLKSSEYAKRKGLSVEIIKIRPVEYIRLAAKNRNGSIERELVSLDDNIVKKYERRFIDIVKNNENDSFPLPFIAPNENQEGRHRTVALHNVLQKILKTNDGFKNYINRVKIPVAIFKPHKEND